eukprot:GDKI01024874.1.p1 GENE.GDKI01024874.1~~GDKI01024874.1.p1  ORF type:complete len:141 (-),score=38.80 GDKI01024874.1:406-828(-)
MLLHMLGQRELARLPAELDALQDSIDAVEEADRRNLDARKQLDQYLPKDASDQLQRMLTEMGAVHTMVAGQLLRQLNSVLPGASTLSTTSSEFDTETVGVRSDTTVRLRARIVDAKRAFVATATVFRRCEPSGGDCESDK